MIPRICRTVKLPKRRPRVLSGIARRLAQADVTHEQLAHLSRRYHPRRWCVTRSFITNILSGREACPAWFQREVEDVLAGRVPGIGEE